MNQQIGPGSPHRLGAHFDGNGTNFAVFSDHAQKIDLCLFSPDGKAEIARHTLPEHTGSVWHGYLEGLAPGALYGFRAHGSYAPEQGHRFNPNKLLLDPYTTQMHGRWDHNPALLGYDKASSAIDLSFSKTDSAPFAPKSVVSDPYLFAAPVERAQINRREMLIYETHVKGMTRQLPAVPDGLRGTYEGLASDPVLEHLQRLGVTSVELLPVHAFVNDGFLLERGLVNYWGYNSIGFFAPEPRYFGPAGVAGFRAMVDRFHAAGIEVILDVVYNHTAEGDHRGPTLSFRGLDNASYYRLLGGQPRYYVNDTGCGNTLNLSHPFVLRMVLDSLRFWVERMGVDGFRFDLATTLGREAHGFDPHGGFMDAIRQDPVLSQVHLIAEPWDIGPGGYQLGQFPPEFAEWNDRYRDTLRRYWRGDDHSAQELAACLLGSAGHFGRGGRRAWSSVNFVASHDGFTLADITRYDHRHNLANGEDGHDGHHANFSDNCGVEGPSDDPEIQARRLRRQRNLLATLFLSQGTPMLLAGDEFGNSQDGNNNAYCQDGPIAWLDWQNADEDLTEFVVALSAFRRRHPCLRQSVFLHGGKRLSDDLPDVEWISPDGGALQWRDPGLSTVGLLLRGSAEVPRYDHTDDTVFIAFKRDDAPVDITLPPAPAGSVWQRVMDTSRKDAFQAEPPSGDLVALAGDCVVAFAPVAAQ